MAQVNITIDDKSYRMACDAGQEPHLEKLAARFDAYVGHLKGQFGEIGDNRLLVMAAIMVMDELVDAECRLEAAQADIGRVSTDIADRDGILEAIAERLEALAARAR